MNRGRLLLGGLVAGLISNISGIGLAAFGLGDALEVLATRITPVDATAGLALVHLTTRFAMGLLTVWIYALVRPRLGPGPRQAALVGLILWFIAYAGYLEGLHLLGVFPRSTLLVIGIWGLAELQMMALAGAWLYRE